MGIDKEEHGEFLNAFNRPYFLPVTGFTTATINGPTTALTSISPSLRQTPITNATTTSADNFRMTQLTGDNQSRIIQLVWRITW